MKIVFNGKEYASVEEMPATVRWMYERALELLPDEDRSGVPDALEAMGTAPGAKPRFFVDGKEYFSLDEMPAEVRGKYEGAMRTLEDRDRSGVPDLLEHGGDVHMASSNVEFRVGAADPPGKPVVVTFGGGKAAFLLLAAAVLVVGVLIGLVLAR